MRTDFVRSCDMTRPLRLLLLLLAAGLAFAHPMGNLSVNHYASLEPGAKGIDVTYVLDLAEIPTFELTQSWNVPRDSPKEVLEAKAVEQVEARRSPRPCESSQGSSQATRSRRSTTRWWPRSWSGERPGRSPSSDWTTCSPGRASLLASRTSRSCENCSRPRNFGHRTTIRSSPRCSRSECKGLRDGSPSSEGTKSYPVHKMSYDRGTKSYPVPQTSYAGGTKSYPVHKTSYAGGTKSYPVHQTSYAGGMKSYPVHETSDDGGTKSHPRPTTCDVRGATSRASPRDPRLRAPACRPFPYSSRSKGTTLCSPSLGIDARTLASSSEAVPTTTTSRSSVEIRDFTAALASSSVTFARFVRYAE